MIPWGAQPIAGCFRWRACRAAPLGLAAILLLGSFRLADARAQTGDAAANVLVVQLALSDGYLAVDPAGTKLKLTAQFQALSCQSSNAVWHELVSWLDQAMRKEGRAVDNVIISNKNPRLVKGMTNVCPAFEQEIKSLAQLTTNWAHANTAFWQFKARFTNEVDTDLLQVVGRHVNNRFVEEYNNTSPLVLMPEAEDDEYTNRGRVPFKVRNPVSATYASRSNILFLANSRQWVDAGISSSDLEPLLRKQQGRLWFAQNFHRDLDDYFERMGYDVQPESADATLTVGIAVTPPASRSRSRRIIIQGSPHLRSIQVGLDTNEVSRVLRALYMLLPCQDYQAVSRDWPHYLQRFPLPWHGTNADHSQAILYGSQLSLIEGPGTNLAIAQWYVNRLELQDRLRGLQIVGFAANLLGAATEHRTNKLADLYLAPLAGSNAVLPASAPTNGQPSVVAESDEDNLGPSFGNTNAVARLPSVRSARTSKQAAEPSAGVLPDREPRRQKLEPEHHHSIEVGLSVASKQDVRVYAAYSQSGLTTNDALAASAGFQQQPLGSLNYTHDFLAFDALQRRWSMTGAGFSDYDPNRLLDGVSTTERRTGGTVASQLELFRDWDHHWLRLDVSGGWREVQDKPNSLPSTLNQITDADCGLLYFWRRDGTKYSPNVQLEPHVRLGWSAATAAWFAEPGLRASTHWLLPAFLEFDVRATGLWASPETPLNEQPSFGGEDSVRGYRADAGIGRAVWAVQNELWLPLRYNWGYGEWADRVLRRYVRLAAFLDVGGVYQTSEAFSGFKAGAGLGLRVLVQDSFVLRLDWGQALTGNDSGRGGSFVYLSVSTRRPIFE